DPSREAEFLSQLHHTSPIEIEATPQVATSIAMVDGKPHVFLANFSGLRGGINPIPTPLANITIRTQGSQAIYLPFMGQTRVLSGEKQGDKTVFRLPALERGAVVWIEKQIFSRVRHERVSLQAD